MKWFKHMSNASSDIKLIMVEEKYGVAGYAAYWKIVEYCAGQWKKEDPPVFKMTLKQVALVIKMKWERSALVMETFSQLKLFDIERYDNVFVINFCTLASIRDEHISRGALNSGVSGETLDPRVRGEIELEEEVYKKELPPPIFKFSDKDLEVINFWNSHESLITHEVKDSKILREVSKRLKKFPHTTSEILEGIKNYAETMSLGEDSYWTEVWNLDQFLTRKGAVTNFYQGYYHGPKLKNSSNKIKPLRVEDYNLPD